MVHGKGLANTRSPSRVCRVVLERGASPPSTVSSSRRLISFSSRYRRAFPPGWDLTYHQCDTKPLRVEQNRKLFEKVAMLTFSSNLWSLYMRSFALIFVLLLGVVIRAECWVLDGSCCIKFLRYSFARSGSGRS